MEVAAFRDAAECSHMLSQYGWRWGSQDSSQGRLAPVDWRKRRKVDDECGPFCRKW